jgi:chromosome segregation ATPase
MGIELVNQALASPTATTITGIAAGGVSVTYLAKVLFSRMIDNYDKKQDEQSRKLENLTDKFAETLTDIRMKLALLEVAVLESKNMRVSFKELEDRYSNLEKSISKAHDRIELIREKVAEICEQIAAVKKTGTTKPSSARAEIR